jgi:cephalosporin hydroxylase
MFGRRRDPGMPGADYFRWFYDTGVWKNMHYRGIRILKVPSDLWNYQEIFAERGIEWVVETGTRHGGSALFFADLLFLNGSAGRVLSVDVDAGANVVKQHPKIDFILGDSGSEAVAAELKRRVAADRGPLFLILDSEHAKAHVLRELNALVPLLRKDDYLVVEDTCINGHPVRPGFGPGPYEALDEYLSQHPEAFVHDTARERKFGFTAAPNGYLVRQ